MLTQDKGKRKKEEEPSNLFAAKGFAPGPSWVNLPGGSNGKSVCLKCGRPGFNRWVGKIIWRRKWQPIPVLLLGKFHGWRNLVGYTPWDCKESDTTEWLHSLTPHGFRSLCPLYGSLAPFVRRFSLWWLQLLRSTGSRYAGFSSCGAGA